MQHFVKKIGLTTLISAMAGILATANPAQAAEFTSSQKEEIEQIIYDYFMENPETIFEATSRMREKAEKEKQYAFEKNFKENKDKIFNGTDPFIGNPDGDVVVVEFFDYNCGYCRKAFDDVLKLSEKDKNLKVVFKELPILSETSREAARWALAAQKQGRYFDFHKALMNGRSAPSEAVFIKIAEKLDLDVDQLKKDVKDDAIEQHIDENLALSRSLGIQGTPAFIIGDILAPGYMGLNNMKLAIEEYRKNKKD